MKITLTLLWLLVVLNQSQSQNITRRDAADAINFIDNLTTPLKPAADDVVFYWQSMKIKANKSPDGKLPGNEVDSLKHYYKTLTKAYQNAIALATQNKTINKFMGLKQKLLNMLNEGQSPWIKVIPVYIKLFSKGEGGITNADKQVISNAGNILMASANKVLEFAKILAIQEDEIEKKYHLELRNDVYQ